MVEEWIKGWKVLSKERHSCTWRARSAYSVCCYPKGEITTRRRLCGPLAVFKTRQHARDFRKAVLDSPYRRRNTLLKIVKCLYKRSRPAEKTLWEKMPDVTSTKFNDTHHMTSYLPEGTVFADAVHCLE